MSPSQSDRKAVYQLSGEPSRFYVPSGERDDIDHCVSFHRTTDPEYIEERCTCESFQMGIPRMIKEGKVRNTIANRRCKHIRRVLAILTHEAKKAIIRHDPSQTEESLTQESEYEAGVRTNE